MSDFWLAAAALSLLIWLHLALFRAGFWRSDQRLPDTGDTGPGAAVIAVVPARDEGDVVEAAVESLLSQDHMPPLRVVLVDDGSRDGTAAAAKEAARRLGAADRLTILAGAPRPPGWTGKLWAVHQGVRHAVGLDPPPRYLLMTDADIAHHPRALARLVAKAEAEGRHLVSLMVRLHCASPVECLLIPAFVFFFQKLYPFPAVNDPRSRTAGAAGGCMLVRATALERAGGIAAIRGALIDDCALARRIKQNGPIWLGLTARTVGLRRHAGLPDIWRMVSRNAYTQLRHSPILLAGTVLGMALTYLAPPLSLAAGVLDQAWGTAVLASAAWVLMGMLYSPTLRLYELSPAWSLALPVGAALYTLMTLDSARRHWRGRGGEWKGRISGGLDGDVPKRGSAEIIASPRDPGADPRSAA